jgi:hypothetical protein
MLETQTWGQSIGSTSDSACCRGLSGRDPADIGFKGLLEHGISPIGKHALGMCLWLQYAGTVRRTFLLAARSSATGLNPNSMSNRPMTDLFGDSKPES